MQVFLARSMFYRDRTMDKYNYSRWPRKKAFTSIDSRRITDRICNHLKTEILKHSNIQMPRSNLWHLETLDQRFRNYGETNTH